jgi:Na+/melibiose symporter-like transporter
MKHLVLVILILYLTNFIFSQSGKSCKSNLECEDSACCREDKCQELKWCQDEANKVYLAVGCVGIMFLIITIIYFIFSIRKIRENVRKIKENLNVKDG